MVKNSKGQLKIQQTAFMLLAVTLFFVLVGMFVLVIQFSNLNEASELIREEEAISLVSNLADSPEFACGETFQSSRIDCIDLDKVRALKNNIEVYGKSFWGVEKIEIAEIYPENERIEIVSGSSMSGSIGVSNFVALCEKKQETGMYTACSIGKLIVHYEN